MKRTIISGAVLSLAVGTMGTGVAGTNDGQGAQKRGITVSTSQDAADCEPGGEAARKGFAILNAPGKEGEVKKIVGPVSLKDGAPDTAYMVFLAVNGVGMFEDTLTTNGQGNGNAKIDFDLGGVAGQYFVVLKPTAGEILASEPVTLR